MNVNHSDILEFIRSVLLASLNESVEQYSTMLHYPAAGERGKPLTEEEKKELKLAILERITTRVSAGE
jgi:hypothetical protein